MATPPQLDEAPAIAPSGVGMAGTVAGVLERCRPPQSVASMFNFDPMPWVEYCLGLLASGGKIKFYPSPSGWHYAFYGTASDDSEITLSDDERKQYGAGFSRLMHFAHAQIEQEKPLLHENKHHTGADDRGQYYTYKWLSSPGA